MNSGGTNGQLKCRHEMECKPLSVIMNKSNQSQISAQHSSVHGKNQQMEDHQKEINS